MYKYKGHKPKEENMKCILHRTIMTKIHVESIGEPNGKTTSTPQPHHTNPTPQSPYPSESLNNEIGLFNGAGLMNFPVPAVIPTIPKFRGSFSLPGLTTLELPADDGGANALNL